MANKKKTETAPEQEGAVLNQEVVAETETVIEEVIKDALDATNDAKVITETDAEAQAKATEGVFEHKGVLYTFVDETPETLSLDEGLFTQAEILLNHELMQSLIETNCIFIKQA